MMKYYVTHHSYCGPNQYTVNEAINILGGKYYLIATSPGSENLSHRVVTGNPDSPVWLGQSGDWNKYHLAEFESFEKAEKFVVAEIGRPLSDIRYEPENGSDPNSSGSIYYENRNKGVQDAYDWYHEGLADFGVEAGMLDIEIEKIADKLRDENEKELYERKIELVGDDIYDILIAYREGLE